MAVGPSASGRIPQRRSGDPVDDGPRSAAKSRAPIRRPTRPSFVRAVHEGRGLRDAGIKVIDLLAPYRRAAARSASSGAPASARRSSSRKAHQQRLAKAHGGVSAASQAWASAPARGNDLCISRMTETKLQTGEAGHQQDGPRLRPDERAPGGARARRAQRPDGRRILPRRGEAGRPPLRRQHLPLHPGGVRGVGAPGPHPERGRLSADPVHRDGRSAGAHHVDEQGVDYRAFRPSTSLPTTSPTPPPRRHIRPPRRHDGSPAARSPRSGSTRRSTPRLHVDPSRRVRRRAAPLRLRAPGADHPAEVQGSAGHHRHPRHGRAQ